MKSALRWGLIIGFVNLLWLYGSFYLGMHTKGIVSMQMVVIVAAIINVVGYVSALGMETKHRGPMPYGTGVKFGLAISVICAVFAACAQIGYFTVVNPGWTAFMVGETRKHFTQAGVPPEKIEILARHAEKSFSLQSYMIQSAVSALFLGTLLSLILMLILKAKKPKAPLPPA